MMGMPSVKFISGKCSRCGVETEHDIVAVYTKGLGFGFALECPVCGKLVPEQAWFKYQRTGDVVVPNMRRGTRTTRQSGYIKATKDYK